MNGGGAESTITELRPAIHRAALMLSALGHIPTVSRAGGLVWRSSIVWPGRIRIGMVTGWGLFLMRRAGDKRSGLYFMTLPADWFDH